MEMIRRLTVQSNQTSFTFSFLLSSVVSMAFFLSRSESNVTCTTVHVSTL